MNRPRLPGCSFLGLRGEAALPETVHECRGLGVRNPSELRDSILPPPPALEDVLVMAGTLEPRHCQNRQNLRGRQV